MCIIVPTPKPWHNSIPKLLEPLHKSYWLIELRKYEISQMIDCWYLVRMAHSHLWILVFCVCVCVCVGDKHLNKLRDRERDWKRSSLSHACVHAARTQHTHTQDYCTLQRLLVWCMNQVCFSVCLFFLLFISGQSHFRCVDAADGFPPSNHSSPATPKPFAPPPLFRWKMGFEPQFSPRKEKIG